MAKSISVLDTNKELFVLAFGYEDDFRNAHWGKGQRDAYFIHYVLKGEGYFNGNKVKAGQGFFIHPGNVHEYHSSNRNPWNYFWIILKGEKANEICKKHINYSSENGIFEYNFTPELLNLADSIFENGASISGMRALGYFFFIMSLHENIRVNTGNKYVEEAKKYMKIHFPYKITVIQVAEALNISDRYLYNLFVKQEGIPPKKYLSKLKINRACDMLRNSSCPVSEVAISVGFDDVLAFSRFFSKNKGISPTEYRKNSVK